MSTALFLTLASVAAAPAPDRPDEVSAKSKIVSVGLFKNGLAVVQRELTLGKPGVYTLDDVPNPVHGTFWIESATPVEAVVEMRDVEVQAGETLPGNLQDDLVGRNVTVHLKGERMPPVTGTVMKIKPSHEEEEVARAGGAYMHYRALQPMRYLVLKTGNRRSYVEASEIAVIESDDAGQKVSRRMPRLLLTLTATDKAETKVRVNYLSRGLGWAPSYKIDITDPKTLALEQQAVVRNELADLDGAEVRLISGFPSVQFANVASPLAARTSWAAFFQELSQRGRGANNDLSNNFIVGQQAIAYNSAPIAPINLGATPSGEGVDLHYQSLGKRTLAEGATLAVSVSSGKSSYERIVEWLVPDTRDEFGRHNEGRNRGEVEGEEEGAWDALRFKNPLPFPMTTGPALVTADGKFNGQRTSYWVNKGEETVLHVTKALSVRTRSVEQEEQKNPAQPRELVWSGSHQYRRVIVEGEITVCNHRAEEVQMLVRRRFSGELIDAEGKPKSLLREEGVYSVNRRNELVWTMSLKAGEERKQKYRYAVLILN